MRKRETRTGACKWAVTAVSPTTEESSTEHTDDNQCSPYSMKYMNTPPPPPPPLQPHIQPRTGAPTSPQQLRQVEMSSIGREEEKDKI